MPTDNVLVQITTAANMAGIEEAKAGLMGLNASTLLLVAGLAVLYKVGSDGIANFKKQQDAVLELNQAYATQGTTYEKNRAALENFILTNARFISNQYDVMTAMAGLIRAGNSETDALRILNDSLDLAAIKHEDVSVASKSLTLVLAGNSRALRELGISTAEYNAIMKDKLLTTEQKHLALLALIEKKTKDGRLTTDEYTQSQNQLNKSWQDFTGQTGGPLVGILTKINEALSTGVQIMDLYIQLETKLAGLQRAAFSNAGNAPSPNTPLAGRASGGPVQPGSAYTVGEQGPETLVMGDQGGSIMPNGRGGNVTINLYATVADGPALDRFTMQIAQRLSAVRGT